MAEYRMRQSELQTRNGQRIATVVGDEIRDSHNQRVGKVHGTEIRDRNNMKLAVLKGEDIYDSSNRKIGSLSDVRRQVEGANGGATLAALWVLCIR